MDEPTDEHRRIAADRFPFPEHTPDETYAYACGVAAAEAVTDERMRAAWFRLVAKGMTIGPVTMTDTGEEVIGLRIIKGHKPAGRPVRTIIQAFQQAEVWDDDV